MEQQIAAKEQQIAEDKKALAAKEQQIAEDKRALAAKEQQIVEDKKALAAKEQQIAEDMKQKTSELTQGGALGDNTAIVNYLLQKRFPLHKQYVIRRARISDLGSNSQHHGEKKKRIADVLRGACVVCKRPCEPGKGNPVEVVHIVKREPDCTKHKLTFYAADDVSNFLLLCGVDSMENSCHGQFDTFKMSFRHVTSNKDRTQWVVIGGGWRHGIRATIDSKPHRRALHAHLVVGLVHDVLDIPDLHGEPLDMPEEVSNRGVQRITEEVDRQHLSGSTETLNDSLEVVDALPSDTDEE